MTADEQVVMGEERLHEPVTVPYPDDRAVAAVGMRILDILLQLPLDDLQASQGRVELGDGDRSFR
jgi:hypothetical protein